MASVLAVGVLPSVAVARSPMKPFVQADVVFQIDRRLKADVALPEFRFELRADGTWRYFETLKQSITKQASGKLSRRALANVRAQLAAAPWQVSTMGVACMAFAAQTTQYSVDGAHVWTDEMCSGEQLDAKSGKRLARVMAIVNPLIAPTP